MTKFSNLELVKEYPTMLMGKFPLRLYRSKDTKDSFYRYHFGFPEKIVKPLSVMLETTPYWGEQHWDIIDGFWIWWLAITSEGIEVPNEKLNSELKWRLNSANKCRALLISWIEKENKC